MATNAAPTAWALGPPSAPAFPAIRAPQNLLPLRLSQPMPPARTGAALPCSPGPPGTTSRSAEGSMWLPLRPPGLPHPVDNHRPASTDLPPPATATLGQGAASLPGAALWGPGGCGAPQGQP
ncbi:resuscitation-promoting factor RpfA-like [Accipiter gentilis]|nr:resuscitation-promoting factor RpfA-like [Accipiter gentilis]